MPKQIAYPTLPLTKALELSRKIYEFGGFCTIEETAEKLGKSKSGPFLSQISALVKFGLIENKKGYVKTTALFHHIHMAFSEEEKKTHIEEAFNKIILFKDLNNYLKEKDLDLAASHAALVKEFNFTQKEAQKITPIFLESASLLAEETNKPKTKQKERLTNNEWEVSLKGPNSKFEFLIQSQADIDLLQILIKKIEI